MSDSIPMPRIGSVWRAKDGRTMRVEKINRSPFTYGGWWAELAVLPPYRPRQRRKTQQAATCFVDGFLQEARDE